MSNSNSFARQLAFFGRDFAVYAPDLRGFGSNAYMEYPYCLDDYIGEVFAYMRQNGLVRPHIIAHSFGCRIALKASATNPNAFGKLVLCGAAGLKPKPTLKKSLKRLAFNVLKRIIPKKRLKGFYSKDYLSLNGVMRQSFCKIITEHLDGYLPDIFNPTLLVFGDKDKETPLYMAKKLNSGIKNSKLIILNGAGHFCFVDKPLKFNTEVKEFLLS